MPDQAKTVLKYKITILPGPIPRRRFLSSAVVVVLCTVFLTFAGALIGGVNGAFAQTRSLTLYFTHTKETATITYKKNGRYVRSGLRKINRFLRDWRRNEPTKMDPKLLDLVWEVYKRSGSRKPIQVVSGYRSPKTNAALRRRGRGVARKSQHVRGKALDFYLPDVSIKKLRALGLKAHAGGVGYYPGSFIHLDTGTVRYWPRMSRRQLARIFPRGRTLHIPRDGKPLAGYQYARAKYGRSGKKGSVQLASAANKAKGNRTSLLARLFNGGRDEGEDNASAAKLKKVKPAKTTRKPKEKRKKPDNSPLPGVAVAGDLRKKESQADENPDGKPLSTTPKRVVLPTQRPGSGPEPVADVLLASQDNPDIDSAVVSDRFGASTEASPDQKPDMKVEESRFALLATTELTATQRAARALANSAVIPELPATLTPAVQPNKPSELTEEIKLALLGPARSITIRETEPSPVQQVTG